MSLESFVADALEAVEFKLIREKSDIDSEEFAFQPDMAHQIFGENENIFGYKELKINLFYSAGSLDIFYDVKYSKKIEDVESTERLKSDPIHEPLTKFFPDGCYYTNLQEFLDISEKKAKTFEPMGKKVSEFETKDGRHFETYLCTQDTPNFLSYHAKIESFVFWFVDAASKIDHDAFWRFFCVFERFQNSKNEIRWASVGYCSVYQYYAHPDKIRLRISQTIVLPPFQKLGVGTYLIESIYKHFRTPNVADITVEDPSEDFTRIRSTIEVKMCKELPSFSSDLVKLGCSSKMLKDAKDELKIFPKQTRIIYEIIRLAHTNKSNAEEYRSYRVDVKKRMNMTYLRQKRDLEKVLKKGVKVDADKMMMPTVQERMEQLADEYKATEAYYEKILKKVGMAQ